MASGRKFAVFDIDGTLIRWQLYHAITDSLVKRGVIDGRRFETIRGARMAWKKRSPGASFKSYETEIIKAYESALSRITNKELLDSIQEVFEEYKDQVYTYTRGLIKQLNDRGYLLFAISGSQSEIVKLIADHYGFDDYLGTDYEVVDNKFSGQKIFHAAKKDEALTTLAARHQTDFIGSLAVGDSASDIKMLELVEEPIAFNPEKALFEHAKQQGWKIVLERKNMIYELEKRGGKYELVKTNAR